jgi:hypothetical protein
VTVAAGRFAALKACPAGSPVSVFNVGTTTLSTLYADKISGTTAANPVIADNYGNINFFAVPGDYSLAWTQDDAEVSITVTVPADPTEAWPG